MNIPEAVLIQEILEMRKMTIRKLASVTKIKETTMIRMLSGNADMHCGTAYMKLEKFKNKLLHCS
ncbi:MAG: hypothetical protein ACHQAX_04955 [Gammaproteobacteria bacterium]